MPVCTCICRQRGHTTSGNSLFEAAANALRWWEVEQQAFGTAFSPADDEVIEVSVMGSGNKTYRVRVGAVRKWTAGRKASNPG
jgi:uncharacterized protein (UPF0548 family)